MNRFVSFSLCVLLVYLIPQLSSVAANMVTTRVGFVDPDGAFLWATTHHTIQLCLTILVSLILSVGFRELGFNLYNRRKSVAFLKEFAIYFTGFITAGHILLFYTMPAPQWSVPLTTPNVVGELAFKALLSGTAEEPLFRGLVMILLFRAVPGSRKYFGIRLSHAGAIATVLFTLAHIGTAPFSIQVAWISPIQLIQAFILGIFYAIAFDRTRSLLAPIVAHNFANVIFTTIGMIWSAAGQ